MFKLFAPKVGGGGFIVAGLSSENVRRLQEGEPIRATLLGWPQMPEDVLVKDCEVLIMWGETEEAIAQEWQRARRQSFQQRFRGRKS